MISLVVWAIIELACAALFATIVIAMELTDSSYIDLNIFGFQLELRNTEETTFCIFCLYLALTSVICGLIGVIYSRWLQWLDVKEAQLNYQYKNVLLNQKILKVLTSDTEQNDGADEKKNDKKEISHQFRCEICGNMIENLPCPHCTSSSEATAENKAEHVFCPYCGQSHNPEDTFCRKCGHKFEDVKK